MPDARAALDVLSPELMAAATPRWRAADAQAGAALGGFLAWPSFGAAAAFDSNPLQSHGTLAQGATGVRLTPRFVAEREGGVHGTTVYGWADARLYPARPDADQLDGRVGILHDWAPRRDLIVRVGADLAQARDVIDSRQFVTGLQRGRPFTERAATLAASVQKTFGIVFVAPRAELVRSDFAEQGLRTPAGRPALSGQTGSEVSVRLGARLGPALYAFAEPAANWHVLDVGDERSNGSRLVAGLGTDRIGLVDGAVFAGVQRQDYSRYPTRSEPVFGGRLSWWPTPAWTVSLVLDRRLAQAAVGTIAEPLGTPIDATAETLTVALAPDRDWAGEVALQHALIDYLGRGRQDDLLRGSASLNYFWRHDLTLTADLSLTRVRSTIAIASYDRALASLGARYAY